MKRKIYGRKLGLEEKRRQRQALISSFSFIEPRIVLYNQVEKPTPYQGQQTWLIARDLALKNNCRYFIFDMYDGSLPPIKNRNIAEESATLLGSVFDSIIVVNAEHMMQEYVGVLSKQVREHFYLCCVNSVSEAIEIVKKELQETEEKKYKTIKLGIGKNGR